MPLGVSALIFAVFMGFFGILCVYTILKLPTIFLLTIGSKMALTTYLTTCEDFELQFRISDFCILSV